MPLPQKAPSLPPPPPGTPLYVHLPFCAEKCHYCDFFSLADRGQDVDGTLDALLIEAEHRAPRRPRTVFLGGGTPSLLSERQLARVLDGLDEFTDFRASATEVTAECNPESLDEQKAKALLALGVRRLSIGFQSLDDRVLALFGRVHSAADSLRAFDAARAADIPHLSIDMIYAVPDQTVTSWERDLTRVLNLGADHLSAYNLTFEEGTPFHRWLAAGKLQRLPEEHELALFDATRSKTQEHGLDPYEVSNFAAPGAECMHNVNYWRNGPYVGIGPSAVSKIGQVRAGNPRSLGAWRAGVRGLKGAPPGTGEPQRAPFDWSEEPPPEVRLAETWWLGLRLREGVHPGEARATAGLAQVASGARAAEGVDSDPALAIARELEVSGHLAAARGRFALTPKGLPVADAISREFLRRLPLENEPAS